jgi:hypothetical protein
MGYRGSDALVKGVVAIDESDDTLIYRVLMSPNQAIATAKACGEYNYATPERLETFIKGAARICDIPLSQARSSGTGIYWGREFSRVLYVAPGTQMTAEQQAALKELAIDCGADEYAATEGWPWLYRVWWD